MTDNEMVQIDYVIARLIAKYPAVPPSDIEIVVRNIHQRFADARIHDYIPLLVEKAARSVIAERVAIGEEPMPVA